MASRGFTTLLLALVSCTSTTPLAANPTPSPAPTVIEHDATPSERWIDLDIADTPEHSVGCAVEQTGALWCWGADPTLQAQLRPQLGPAELSTRQRSGPTRVEGVAAARAVAVSRDEVCRLDDDGRVHCVRSDERCWRAIEGVADAAQIVVTDWGGCAIQRDRTLRCWAAPSPARTLAQDVLDVTMDDSLACALRTDGEVWCWDEESPPASLGHIPHAIDIALDDYLWLLVLDAEGRVVADQVADGKAEWLERSPLPKTVELEAGKDHLCGRTAEGIVQCRGANDHGQLGGGDSKGTDELITMILGEGQSAREVAVGEQRTCVRTTDEILCVGNDASAWAPPPGTVHQHRVELEAVSLAAHAATTCAIDRAGDLRCWGGDFYLQPNLGIQAIATPTLRASGGKALLGIHTTDDVLYWIDDGRLANAWIGPPAVADNLKPPKPQPEIHAFASEAFACAIEASARGPVVACGEIEERTPIAGIERPTALASFGDQLCAIDHRAHVVCSPLASKYAERKPVSHVIAGVQNARSIAAMLNLREVTMCAALETGRVLCWDGHTTHAGDNQEEYVATPATDVGLTEVTALVGSSDWFCSLDRAGAVACWTPESGRTEPRPGPTIDAEVVQLVAGRYHACARDRAGGVTCWGEESDGQLGRVPAAVSLQPTPLRFAP